MRSHLAILDHHGAARIEDVDDLVKVRPLVRLGVEADGQQPQQLDGAPRAVDLRGWQPHRVEGDDASELGARVAVKRDAAGAQLPKYDAKGPDVGARAVRDAEEHLRRCPLQSIGKAIWDTQR